MVPVGALRIGASHQTTARVIDRNTIGIVTFNTLILGAHDPQRQIFQSLRHARGDLSGAHSIVPEHFHTIFVDRSDLSRSVRRCFGHVSDLVVDTEHSELLIALC